METIYVGAKGQIQDIGPVMPVICAAGVLRVCGNPGLGDRLLEWVQEWSITPVDAAGRERLQGLAAEVEANGPQLRACRAKLLGLL